MFFINKNKVLIQIPFLHTWLCGILYCTFQWTLQVVDSFCEVLTKYTVRINPSCIQFRSAPKSIKAIKAD